jgi:hypothetical protein
MIIFSYINKIESKLPVVSLSNSVSIATDFSLYFLFSFFSGMSASTLLVNRKLETFGGSRLLCLSEFHLGSEVSCFLNHDLLLPEFSMNKKLPVIPSIPGLPPMMMHGGNTGGGPSGGSMIAPPPPPPPPRTRRGSTFPLQIFGTRLTKLSNYPAYNPYLHPFANSQRKTSLVLGTMDGMIGQLLPLEEKMYKRLLLLQQILTMIVPMNLSLNHKEFRQKIKQFHLKYPNFLTYLTFNHLNISNKRMILDGNLIYSYLTYDCFMQDEIAQLIGVNSYVLRENLHEMDYLLKFF